MLRKGAVRVISLPPRKPAEGAKRGKPPVRVGQAYTAYALANAEFGRQSIRVMVVDLTEGDGEWLATVRSGYAPDHAVFLAARPGEDAQGGDYTIRPHRAASDEPEVVDVTWETQVARMAKAERANRRPDTRPWRNRGT